MNSSVPIEANGIIPISQSDVAGIPSIALTIPDFEGQAILRVFANSTQSQIACFSAVLSNGATFAHPAAVSSVLGVFTVVALVSSVAVTVYGQNVPETRKHYAHSVSMFVVFSVFQHIFFTGALSMNWPSVLVAFWSNYAWSAGIIYSQKMQNTINGFIGNNRGNISMVGSAPSGENAVGLGGGYSISQIYKRALSLPFEPYEGTGETLRPPALELALRRRQLENSTSGFSWYGKPVLPGLPLPGNYSGFAGTLAEVNIPASNAFLTGFLWFLVLMAGVAAAMVLLKWVIEGLAAIHLVKSTRLAFFRQHWFALTVAAVLRTCFIAFFMFMFLTMFQFTLGGAAGVEALAAVVFVLFFLGMIGTAAYALYYRTKSERLVSESVETNPSLEKLSFRWYAFGGHKSGSPTNSGEQDGAARPPPRWRSVFPDVDTGRLHVHDDENYTTKFGWLTSRFRRSKWWFFSFWLVYEFVRACFYGGAAGHALTQVFGLLAWEIIAFVAIVSMRPFESNRLNVLMVYLLGFSKVATVALSSAFDERFNLGRILTTVIGIVIIVIQGVLTVCLMIAIALGAMSSYISITRYHEKMKPRSWLKLRTRYFAHIDQKATDRPKPPRPPTPVPETPKEPYFTVSSVRREPKIEDEDPDPEIIVDYIRGEASMDPDTNLSHQAYPSRSHSIRSRTSVSNLPFGARPHRASWSTRDFQDYDVDRGQQQTPSGTHSRMSIESVHEVGARHRTASFRGPSRNGTPTGPLSVPAGGSDLQIQSSRRTRSGSYPMRSQRNSSIVNEEQETN